MNVTVVTNDHRSVFGVCRSGGIPAAERFPCDLQAVFLSWSSGMTTLLTMRRSPPSVVVRSGGIPAAERFTFEAQLVFLFLAVRNDDPPNHAALTSLCSS